MNTRTNEQDASAAAADTDPPTRPTDHSPAPQPVRSLLRMIQAERLSGIYLLVMLIAAYSAWLPATFASGRNFQAILAQSAISGIIALSATVALIAGAFDISIAANMSFAISFVGWLQSVHHVNALVAVALTLASGVVVGTVNAFVITRLGVNPVVATLGMSSLLAAVSYWVAKGQTIVDGISPTFAAFGTTKILGIAAPVFYLLAIALILGYLLRYTPVGRYMYAAGGNPDAARLAGLPVGRLKWYALMISGLLSSFAGVVLTMQLSAASFDSGAPYLLPAYAAAFLGSTQILPGRFNVAGTMVGLFLLAVGVKGLQLRFPELPWIADLFQGLALIVSVALGVLAVRAKQSQSPV